MIKRAGALVLLLFAACSSGGTAPATPGVTRFKLGQYKTDAVLTVPADADRVPAIVMMSGSGTGDEDETVGALKPFRDLADGLAKQGIATVRYAKSLRRALNTKGFTPTDEYEPDAEAAFEYLSARTDVDRSRIFLLGHSLGGTMAPRVATDEPRFRGVILMAASVEGLASALVRQVHDTGGSPQAVSAAVDFARQVDDPNLQPDTKITGPFGGGTTGAYFLDLRNYNPIAVAKALPRPLLLLQGERDYQVTIADNLDLWVAGLKGKTDVKVIRYPQASHAFVDGTGPASPADYAKPGQVDNEVIADIAAWIKAH